MNVLDLPESRQRAFAAEEGLSLEAWREGVARRLKETDEFLARIDAEAAKRPPPTPEQIEAARRFQARVDSEQLTNAVLNRRARGDK